MKIKVGDDIYDSNDVPIMIIMTEDDLHNIKNMPENLRRYACFPENWEEVDDDIKLEWMRNS